MSLIERFCRVHDIVEKFVLCFPLRVESRRIVGNIRHLRAASIRKHGIRVAQLGRRIFSLFGAHPAAGSGVSRPAGRFFLTIPLRLAYSNRRRRLSPTSASFVNGIGRAIKTGRASSFYFPHILRTRPAGRFFLTIPLRLAYSSRRRGFPLLSAGFGNGTGRAVLYGGGASSLHIPHIVHNHTIIPVCDRQRKL